ncbi:UNVERIFIED_CONTAM: hypothetical protein Scaly_2883200 [Sesamum calycinum]|uniref:Uncharacterized protein n=1 Tax=Sesamum calycinum TaxID=2727403 RepID=A0AAW2LBQ4_9LAMI
MGIYGDLNLEPRKPTWSLLSVLSFQSHSPLLCAKDYNEILQLVEKQGGLDRPKWQMQCFLSAFQVAGIHDLDFERLPFTLVQQPNNPGYCVVAIG